MANEGVVTQLVTQATIEADPDAQATQVVAQMLVERIPPAVHLTTLDAQVILSLVGRRAQAARAAFAP